MANGVEVVNQEVVKKESFWSYLKLKELDFYPQRSLQWWLIIVMTIAWATEKFENTRLSPVIVYFLKEFNIDLKYFAMMYMMTIVTSALGGYVIGEMSDRIGRRQAILWPMFAYLFIIVGMATAPSALVYFILAAVGYFFVTGMATAVTAAVRDIVPRTSRGLGFAFISVAWTLGSFMSAGVAAATIPIWPGWRPQMWIGLVVATIITAFVTIFYRDISHNVRSKIVANQEEALKDALAAHGIADIEALRRSGAVIYRKPYIWIVCCVAIFWGIPWFTLAAYLPTYLIQWYGVHPAKAAGLASWFFLLYGICVFLGGYISDKTGLRKLTMSVNAFLTGVLIIYAALLPKTTSYETLLIVWSLVAFFSGLVYPSFCAILAENAEAINPFSVGRAFGIVQIVSIFVGLTLGLVMPQVVERSGWSTWIACCGVLCPITILCISFAKGPWLKAAK